MKRNTSIFLLLSMFVFTSCNSARDTNAKQDSLAAAAAADSMLNEALKADSLYADSLKR